MSRGTTVWYVVLDSSSDNDADAKGIHRSQKLANARCTTAVQKVTAANGIVDFPASVDFSPAHIIDAPAGFPPTVFQAGAVGQVVGPAPHTRDPELALG